MGAFETWANRVKEGSTRTYYTETNDGNQTTLDFTGTDYLSPHEAIEIFRKVLNLKREGKQILIVNTTREVKEALELHGVQDKAKIRHEKDHDISKQTVHHTH